jgi:hypothetical protein
LFELVQAGLLATNALDPPTGTSASKGDSTQSAQLVQAMAGFGGGSGAADGLNAVALGARHGTADVSGRRRSTFEAPQEPFD